MQITTADLAAALETTTRDARKFLRSDASGIESVGKGSRYLIEKRDLRPLKTRFAKWDKARNEAKADKALEADNTDNSDTPED